MAGKRQFSLSYLFLEIFWIALALGITRFVIWTFSANSALLDTLRFVLVPGGLACYGASVGGCFGKMRIGAACGAALFFIWLVFFAPTVQH